MKKIEQHFGINPINNQWEYMGESYTNPDYLQKSIKISSKTLKFCIDVTKSYLEKEILKEENLLLKLANQNKETYTKNAKITQINAKHQNSLYLCGEKIKNYKVMLEEIKCHY